MPARITDGCGPTASTYAPIDPSAASSAPSRETPSRSASATVPPATMITLPPLTASRW